MRPTGIPRRAGTVGLAGAAALAVLTACSGGGSSSATSSATTTAPTTTSSPATTTPSGPTGADAVFCDQVSQLVPELSTVQSAPAPQVPGLLQQLVAAFQKIQPPAAIASDWQALGEGVRRLQSALGSIDLTTAKGQAELEQLEKQTTASASAAQGHVTTWVLGHCSSGPAGTSTGASDTAATSPG